MSANDNENIVGPGEAALIVAPDGDIRVIVPDPDDYPDIHPNAVLLGVVAVRARDSEWVEEMLAFYEGNKTNGG